MADEQNVFGDSDFEASFDSFDPVEDDNNNYIVPEYMPDNKPCCNWTAA